VRKEVIGVLAVAGVTCVTAPALAQLQFGLQITQRSQSFAADGSGQVLFALEARALATTGDNFGVTRVGPGGTSLTTRSAITITTGAAGVRVGRDVNESGATRRGRAEAFRFVDPRRGLNQPSSLWEQQFANGPNQTSASLLAGNENGLVTNITGNRSIVLFDSYGGFSRPELPSGGNPWGPSIAPGTWSPWTVVYYFMVDVPAGTAVSELNLSAQASVGAGTTVRQLGTDWLINSSAQQLVTTSLSTVVPTPAGAAVLALGGLVAGRRRRG
jgi:MYXO-CTERM domain-containing protein